MQSGSVCDFCGFLNYAFMKILMVCLGNICRSPMAQGVLEDEIRRNSLDWTVDSAGTNGLHNGENPDKRAIRLMKNQGIDISGQVSRQIQASDLEEFDLIICMDSLVYKQVRQRFSPGQTEGKLYRLMEFSASPGVDVEDPYYDDRFEEALNRIRLGCAGLIRKMSQTN
jgi:protein-tyrosine phosphatase